MSINDVNVVEFDRNAVRKELEDYLDDALHKLDSDGELLISIPDNFDEVVDLLDRKDLNDNSNKWSKYLFDAKFDENLQKSHSGRYSKTVLDLEDDEKIEKGLAEIHLLDMKLRKLNKKEYQLKKNDLLSNSKTRNTENDVCNNQKSHRDSMNDNTFITSMFRSSNDSNLFDTQSSPLSSPSNTSSSSKPSTSNSSFPQKSTTNTTTNTNTNKVTNFHSSSRYRFPLYKTKLSLEDENRIQQLLYDDDDVNEDDNYNVNNHHEYNEVMNHKHNDNSENKDAREDDDGVEENDVNNELSYSLPSSPSLHTSTSLRTHHTAGGGGSSTASLAYTRSIQSPSIKKRLEDINMKLEQLSINFPFLDTSTTTSGTNLNLNMRNKTTNSNYDNSDKNDDGVDIDDVNYNSDENEESYDMNNTTTNSHNNNNNNNTTDGYPSPPPPNSIGYPSTSISITATTSALPPITVLENIRQQYFEILSDSMYSTSNSRIVPKNIKNRRDDDNPVSPYIDKIRECENSKKEFSFKLYDEDIQKSSEYLLKSMSVEEKQKLKDLIESIESQVISS